MQLSFKPARKARLKLKMAIAGPPGSGKTKTSLVLAERLNQIENGGGVAVIDSEHESSCLYSRQHAFDVCAISCHVGEDPATVYHPSKYIEALHLAIRCGYNVAIVDSLSHAWKAVLSHVDALSKKNKGNSYVSWGGKDGGTALQTQFIETILAMPIHVIVTMRSKMDYVLETSLDGKTKPKKVGMAPVQRDDTEYEFRVVAAMDNAVMTIEKSTGFCEPGRVIPYPGPALADELAAWLEDGDVMPTIPPPPVQAPPPPPPPASLMADFDEAIDLAQRLLITPDAFNQCLQAYYRKPMIYELNNHEIADLLIRLRTAYANKFIPTPYQ